MRSLLSRLAGSAVAQILLTLVTYAFYASIIGLCLVPSLALVVIGVRPLLAAAVTAGSLVLGALCLGAALYAYFITGCLVMSLLIRLLSLGIRPGRHAMGSPTMFRWLLYSGIYTLAINTVLPMIPVTFFSNLFFRVAGCRFGRNVYLNSYMLNEPYLIEIGDNVTIGGQTDISGHLFEGNSLILGRIRIGSGTLVGAHCYIAPDVTIGRNCVIGLGAYIRRGSTIPDGTVISSLGGLPIRDLAALEKSARRHRGQAGFTGGPDNQRV